MASLSLPDAQLLDQPSFDVLAVFAHPDDAELLCGGALAAGVAAGQRVGILDLTRGEAGSRGSAELRAEEALEAVSILGVAGRWTAGLPDGELQDDPEARRIVAGCIRHFRPRVVVTHWTTSRHPDHRAAAALVIASTFLAGLGNLDAPGPPMRPDTLVHATAFRADAPPPSFVVDVTTVMERRDAALAAFVSQFDGATTAGEVQGGGDRPLPQQIHHVLASEGRRIGVPYGEPFVTRAPFAQPHLGSLPVSSF